MRHIRPAAATVVATALIVTTVAATAGSPAGPRYVHDGLHTPGLVYVDGARGITPDGRYLLSTFAADDARTGHPQKIGLELYDTHTDRPVWTWTAPTSTDGLDPAVSDSGQDIVFSVTDQSGSDSEIFYVDRLAHIIRDLGAGADPSISGDGSTIAFTRCPPGSASVIGVMGCNDIAETVATGRLTTFAQPPEGGYVVYSAPLSYHGDRVAYIVDSKSQSSFRFDSRTGCDLSIGVFVRDLHPLSRPQLVANGNPTANLNANKCDNLNDVALSQDGRYLAWTEWDWSQPPAPVPPLIFLEGWTSQGQGHGVVQVLAEDLRSKQLRRVDAWASHGDGAINYGNLAMSANGQWIAYSRVPVATSGAWEEGLLAEHPAIPGFEPGQGWNPEDVYVYSRTTGSSTDVEYQSIADAVTAEQRCGAYWADLGLTGPKYWHDPTAQAWSPLPGQPMARLFGVSDGGLSLFDDGRQFGDAQCWAGMYLASR